MYIATLLTEALSLIAASKWFDGMLYAVDKANSLAVPSPVRGFESINFEYE